MKKILRVKWELVMVILNLVACGVAWFSYFYTKEINVFVIALISLFCLVAVLMSYKTIAYMRKTTLRMW